MKRILILVVVLPVLALGAGVVAGMLASRLPADSNTEPQSPLLADLRLTTDQRDQMQVIWEGVQKRIQMAVEQATALQKQREDALVALLNDEQKAQFEKISRSYLDRFNEVEANRQKVFSDAVEQTKKLLDEPQRVKYEQILKDHVGTTGGILTPRTPL